MPLNKSVVCLPDRLDPGQGSSLWQALTSIRGPDHRCFLSDDPLPPQFHDQLSLGADAFEGVAGAFCGVGFGEMGTCLAYSGRMGQTQGRIAGHHIALADVTLRAGRRSVSRLLTVLRPGCGGCWRASARPSRAQL